MSFSGFEDALDRFFGGLNSDGRLKCPIPGHTGHAFLDIPPDDPSGDLRLMCCRGHWRSLGEVRAAMAYGGDSRRSNREIAVWTRRLGYEVGAFEPVEIHLPPLRSDAPPLHWTVANGFRLLVGLRWADHDEGPVLFTARFAAAWCGCSSSAAHHVVLALVESGVIVVVGRLGKMRLFLPGAAEPSDRSRDLSV